MMRSQPGRGEVVSICADMGKHSAHFKKSAT
jgi:hypothetical protein